MAPCSKVQKQYLCANMLADNSVPGERNVSVTFGDIRFDLFLKVKGDFHFPDVHRGVVRT